MEPYIGAIGAGGTQIYACRGALVTHWQLEAPGDVAFRRRARQITKMIAKKIDRRLAAAAIAATANRRQPIVFAAIL